MPDPRLTGSEGDPRSPLWWIGRDYGQTEAATGLPFQGKAGYLLESVAGLEGLQRRNIFVHNVVPEQPPGNNWYAHKEHSRETGVANLQALLQEFQPKLVVAFGNEALRTCLGFHPDDKHEVPGITDCRGYLWESSLGPRVLGSVHPAAILREWTPWRPIFQMDLRKARTELQAGCPPLPVRHVEVVTEPAMLQEVRNAMEKARWVAMDIENTKRLELSCLGIGVSRELAFVIPAEEPWQLTGIQEMLAHPVGKIWQNGFYDRYFLERLTTHDARRQRKYGWTVEHTVFDTMHAWHVLQPELAAQADPSRGKKGSQATRKSLAFLASIYCRDPWWKDYGFTDEMERYTLCGRDTCITLEVAEKQGKELENG